MGALYEVAIFIFTQPGSMIMVSTFVIIVCMLIAIGSGLQVTLAPTTWYDTSNIITQRQFGYQTGFQAWADMISDAGTNTTTANITMSKTLDTLYLVFESNDSSSLLTETKIAKMKAIEESIVGLMDFSEWCQINELGACTEFTSLTATLSEANGDLKEETAWNPIISSLWCEDATTKTPLSTIMAGADFSCDPASGYSTKYMKSMLSFGGPLKGFDSVQTDTAEQHRNLGNNYFLTVVAPHLKAQAKEADAVDMTMYFGGLNQIGGVAYGIVLSYLTADMMLAVGSMMFVLIYLMINLKSFFLAFMGFFEIIVSVPMSFGIFALIGNKYVSFLQFMGLFIIMGIGADDIFVFIDAYNQAKNERHLTEQDQFAFAYSRAAKAMLVTSCTSGVAFFATAISPIPAVAAFGLTMGFMVFADFFLVITWFPAAVAINRRYCCAKPLIEPSEERMMMPKTLGKIETWFNKKFMNFIGNATTGKGITGAFVVLMIASLAASGGSLKVTGDLPENFDEEHEFTKFRDLSVQAFPTSGGIPKIPVSVFFGIDSENPVDRDGLDPQSDIVANFAYHDSSFNLTDHSNQAAIANLCTALASNTDMVWNNEVYCFMNDFKAFLNASSLDWSDGTHGKKILSPEFMDFQRLKFSERYAGGGMKSGVVVDGYEMNTTGLEFVWEAGEVDLFDAFAFITFNSTLPLKPNIMSLAEMRAWMEAFDALIEIHNAANPGAKGLQFCLYWYFMIAGEAIVQTTFNGIGISLGFAALVLLIANKNYIIASLAIVTILGVVGVIGLMMVILGWSVDFLGSVCLIVVIGLSVDYTVHLCHSYVHSQEEPRLERTKQAATEMGVSIVSGAVTSFGASFFLLLCSMTFFNQFGTFMCATIIVSLFFSIWFFLTACTLVGPKRRDEDSSDGDFCGGSGHAKVGIEF